MIDWLLVLSLFFHVVATVIWIGGLILMTVIVWPEALKLLARADPSGALNEFLERFRKRFYLLANLSLMVLVVTGLFQMDKDRNYQGFLQFNNDWSRAILLKHMAVAGMVVVGGIMQWGVLPALERAMIRVRKGLAAPDLDRLRKQERRLVAINCALGVLVLVCTAVATAI
jgi:uncharacterized membrane protein